MKTRNFLALVTSFTMSVSAVGSSFTALAAENYTAVSVPYSDNVKSISKLDQVIEEARKLVGIQGRPNPVTLWWNSPYTDYCAMTIPYVLVKCGINDGYPYTPYVDKTAEFRGFRDWFESNGKFTYSPYNIKPGYFVVFGENNYGTHIGIISATNYTSHTITVIEGNTVNDAFEELTYSMYDPRIIGYCMMEYDEYDISGEPDYTVPDASVTEYNCFFVSGPDGAWLRAMHSYGKKIGILSTGSVLYSDRRFGEWVHVLSASIEEASGYYDGWVHISNLSKSDEGHGSVNTTTTVSAASTTTTTLTTAAASTTTALPETTYSPLVTTFTANLNPGFKPELMKIASDIGGKFRETPDLTTEYNVKKILDTGALFNKTDTVNGFAYGFLEDTSEFGYVHLSILTSFDDTNVSSSTRPTHRVSSDVGCKARSSANFWSDTLMILDTDQLVTVLYPENGFFYCEFTLPDGSVHNAYIHNSVISPLS